MGQLKDAGTSSASRKWELLVNGSPEASSQPELVEIEHTELGELVETGRGEEGPTAKCQMQKSIAGM